MATMRFRVRTLIVAGLALATNPFVSSQAPEQRPTAKPEIRIDTNGDPLPAGALTRIGTLRFRPGDAAGAPVFTPDGKLFATAMANSTICFWESATGKELQRWEMHNTGLGLAQLVCAADGRILA